MSTRTMSSATQQAVAICLAASHLNDSDLAAARGQVAAKIVLNELFALRHETGLTTAEFLADMDFVEQLRQIVTLRALEHVTTKQAKELFDKAWTERRAVIDILIDDQILDEATGDALVAIIADVIAANPAVVEQIKAGKDKAVGFLVGQVMKQARGRVNPQQAQDALRKAM